MDTLKEKFSTIILRGKGYKIIARLYEEGNGTYKMEIRKTSRIARGVNGKRIGIKTFKTYKSLLRFSGFWLVNMLRQGYILDKFENHD